MLIKEVQQILDLRKKLERKGYAVMKISRTCNLLVGNRKEIFIILLKNREGQARCINCMKGHHVNLSKKGWKIRNA